MRIGLMLEAVMAVLIIGGVGKRTCRENGIETGNAVFFLISMAALSRFTWYPADEAAAYPACILAAAWLFGNAFRNGETGLKHHLILPVSILLGAAMTPVVLAFPEWGYYFFGIPAALLSATAGMQYALAAAGAAPLAAAVISFAYTVSTGGWRMLELTEGCFCAQLTGVLFAVGAKVIINSARTGVRRLSAERTSSD